MHKARMKGRRRTKVIIDALWVDGEGRMHVELKRKVLAQAADEEELVGLLGDLLLVLLFLDLYGHRCRGVVARKHLRLVLLEVLLLRLLEHHLCIITTQVKPRQLSGSAMRYAF